MTARPAAASPARRWARASRQSAEGQVQRLLLAEPVGGLADRVDAAEVTVEDVAASPCRNRATIAK